MYKYTKGKGFAQVECKKPAEENSVKALDAKLAEMEKTAKAYVDTIEAKDKEIASLTAKLEALEKPKE